MFYRAVNTKNVGRSSSPTPAGNRQVKQPTQYKAPMTAIRNNDSFKKHNNFDAVVQQNQDRKLFKEAIKNIETNITKELSKFNEQMAAIDKKVRKTNKEVDQMSQ